jgi:hypothetical protein
LEVSIFYLIYLQPHIYLQLFIYLHAEIMQYLYFYGPGI